ncbi:hypothetical protein ANAPC5_01329 [Anaplasma phagocytophilum]|nr:hypothetical protein ANAPC5_01329 [Anaplasma phagocytophilum]
MRLLCLSAFSVRMMVTGRMAQMTLVKWQSPILTNLIQKKENEDAEEKCLPACNEIRRYTKICFSRKMKC